MGNRYLADTRGLYTILVIFMPSWLGLWNIYNGGRQTLLPYISRTSVVLVVCLWSCPLLVTPSMLVLCSLTVPQVHIVLYSQ